MQKSFQFYTPRLKTRQPVLPYSTPSRNVFFHFFKKFRNKSFHLRVFILNLFHPNVIANRCIFLPWLDKLKSCKTVFLQNSLQKFDKNAIDKVNKYRFCTASKKSHFFNRLKFFWIWFTVWKNENSHNLYKERIFKCFTRISCTTLNRSCFETFFIISSELIST